MTALPTFLRRSHEASSRRPSAVLANVRLNDSERMQTSTLSLATSIPATMRSFCAIIQLPSLLGSGSKPLQLFGLRKTPDLSHAPRQALWPSSTNGLRSSDGRLGRIAMGTRPGSEVVGQDSREFLTATVIAIAAAVAVGTVHAASALAQSAGG